VSTKKQSQLLISTASSNRS